ncbi:restriction endonuclease subunit S [Helicobacter sp. MIT 99-10781]|uniref:restriction endonuclease subunit S n=1 Tax=Helicobacter sp. MIT 99-10781 TaxID=1332285 RepID=UPI001C6A48A9|nr:restriction endonuclease subunit S [Helicobacter sp. MIT 99-10781]
MTDLSKEGDTLGFSAKIPNDDFTYLHNQRIGLVKFICNPDNICKDFIYWLMRSRNYQQFIVGAATGTSVRHTSPTLIKSFTFNIPPLKTQEKIAQILSSFDDKIDLLHKQNKTLETLAQTLFRHHFIENVKESWEEKALSEIADFLNGLACQKFPPKDDINKLPVLKIKELKEGFSTSSDWASSDINSEYIIKSADVIFAWSASLMVKIYYGKKCVLNQHLFRVSSKLYPKWFYYFWCVYHLQEFISIASAHATTMGHIKRQDLDNAMCAVPDSKTLKEFDCVFVPLFSKLENNAKEIQNLESLRDIILKKILG